jgi:hypothetical protein
MRRQNPRVVQQISQPGQWLCGGVIHKEINARRFSIKRK